MSLSTGRLARYVHDRRPGWRLLWRLLPNALGPFYSDVQAGTEDPAQPSTRAEASESR